MFINFLICNFVILDDERRKQEIILIKTDDTNVNFAKYVYR